MNFKLAFDNVKHLVFAFMPVRRRLVSRLRYVLQHAEASTGVFALDEEGHIYSKYVESRIQRGPAFECNRRCFCHCVPPASVPRKLTKSLSDEVPCSERSAVVFVSWSWARIARASSISTRISQLRNAPSYSNRGGF